MTRSNQHRSEQGATLLEVAIVIVPFLSMLAAFLVFALGFVSLGMVSQDVLYAELGHTTQQIVSPSLTLNNLIVGHGSNTTRVINSINAHQPFNPADPSQLSVASYVAGPARARNDAIGLPTDYAATTNPITYTATTISVSDGVDRDGDGQMDPRVVSVGRYFMPILSKLVVSASIVRRSQSKRSTIASSATNRVAPVQFLPVAPSSTSTVCQINCP